MNQMDMSLHDDDDDDDDIKENFFGAVKENSEMS